MFGSGVVKSFLEKSDFMTEEEIDIICSAIYHHDDKANIDSPMDEVLKDADVMHHVMNDLSKPVKNAKN